MNQRFSSHCSKDQNQKHRTYMNLYLFLRIMRSHEYIPVTVGIWGTPWNTGWWFEPLWNILDSLDDNSQWENKKSSKPPTRPHGLLEVLSIGDYSLDPILYYLFWWLFQTTGPPTRIFLPCLAAGPAPVAPVCLKTRWVLPAWNSAHRRSHHSR